MEIFKESKHGDIYDTFGQDYNFDSPPGAWTPGTDYRGPTCSSCHMSGSGDIETTHYVGKRLSWELQAPKYELWHHEGRRARMGTAMMAPDYTWWHGFYECKKRFNKFMTESKLLLEGKKNSEKAKNYPNATDDKKKPERLKYKK